MFRRGLWVFRWFLGLALIIPGAAWAEEQALALTGFEAFAQDPAMTAAVISPNGQHLATMQRVTKDGNQLVMVYDVDDLDANPVVLGSKTMDIVAVQWANDERLIVRFRQDVDTLEDLGVATRLVSKLATVDRRGERWLEIPRRRADRRSEVAQLRQNFGGAQIFDMLPKDDDHILVQYDDDANGVNDIFRVNVKSGAMRKIARNTERTTITYLDEDMEPRLAQRFDHGDEALVFLGRLKGKKQWIEMGRAQANLETHSSAFNALRLADGPASNVFYVISNHESDTAGIYLYDLEKQAFGDLQFRHPRYDAVGLTTKLDEDQNEVITGFSYTGKALDVYLLDGDEQARKSALDEVLPGSRNRVVSRSHSGQRMVIRAEGPRNPPSYHLLTERGMKTLGRSLPFLEPEDLAPVEWVRYKARDGREIPALVTIPNGEGPFPIVVNPHGGPVARDFWGFDLWAQMLAYHGYVVIQPQFRISQGFGRDHLKSGYAQWGRTMQDDLDDAIPYLAERGLGDPGRVGIFGWSYGGYAAFVGSFRDPNPYHCAIAGAGVADIPHFRAMVADSGTFAEKVFRPTMDGINPLNHVDSVDVPILVIHGDKDERVPIAESDKFVRQLEEENKQHEYLVLEGANHFYGTIYYRHWMQMFPKMIQWFDETCGLALR